MPVGWYRPQIVTAGQKVYVGGGVTDRFNMFTILEYTINDNAWKRHCGSLVVLYGLSYFQGKLITVGGSNVEDLSSNVSSYDQLKKQWEERIQPMPTGRCAPAVITTDTAIIVCGGARFDEGLEPVPCRLVEVYNSQTSQWHKSAQLPHPYAAAPFAVIGDHCFLVGEARERGGSRKVTYANMRDLERLQQKDVGEGREGNSHAKVWKELSECPLIGSVAVCFNGALLALGGDDPIEGDTVNHVHAFVPQTNSWVRLEYGALPVALEGSSAAQLVDNRLTIVGGSGSDDNHTNSVFIGSRL